MPLIILEGPDGAGKTSLADEIHRQAYAKGWSVTRKAFGPPPFDPMIQLDRAEQARWDYWWAINDSVDSIVTIIDRCHWGAAVWGPIFRPQFVVDNFGDITRAHFDILESLILSRGGVTALVTNETEVLVNRVLTRGDDMAPKDPLDLAAFMERVHDLYNKVLRLDPPSAAPSPIVLDTPDDTVQAAEKLLDLTLTRTVRLS